MSSILVADIGGTNARFGLVNIAGMQQSQPDYTAQLQKTLKCAEYATIAEMIRDYGQQAGTALPAYACLAIAGPIKQGRVRMTNLKWEFAIADLQQELNMKALDVLNDFAALAYSMPHLGSAELHEIHSGQADPDASMLAVGPGTGFGMAALVPHAGRWKIAPTEGGHTNFAPGTLEEVEVLKYLLTQQARVSVENLVSGSGLVLLYRALAAVKGQQAQDFTPADVSERGLAGTDPLCRSAVDTFCAILGSVVGDKGLSTGARGGIYLGGGIVPRLLEHLPNTTFLQRYMDKGPMTDYMQAIPLNAIVKDTAALIGTAAWLQDTVPDLAG